MTKFYYKRKQDDQIFILLEADKTSNIFLLQGRDSIFTISFEDLLRDFDRAENTRDY